MTDRAQHPNRSSGSIGLPDPAASGDSWPRTNRILTIIASVVLVLMSLTTVVFTAIYFLSSGICGMSCDAAWTLFGRAMTALVVGVVLTGAGVIGALVWRRWSSCFLALAIMILVVTWFVMSAIASTPLDQVLAAWPQ
ncbi:MAG: hypothetical protein WAW85_00560 [Gordonia sp. (in: high G+C Gram-positive bacteria)]|uniref:hypothetical protein n=1 Tax=Gordonia sp. (in: high G+C Gram-positive bacteria) TaxID=84139 RepID=UPI003BB657DE